VGYQDLQRDPLRNRVWLPPWVTLVIGAATVAVAVLTVAMPETALATFVLIGIICGYSLSGSV
jgi:cobalamin synthase